jgi:hypothetical protein
MHETHDLLHDTKFSALFDAILADTGIKVVLSGIQMPG